jgi:poly(3-hydroxybutyrate) depolymerase
MRALRVAILAAFWALLLVLSSCARSPIMPEGATSRCQVTPEHIQCSYQVVEIRDRNVLFQRPVAEPGPNGSPLVLLFQGTGIPPSHAFDAHRDQMFGAYHQAELVHRLLDAGYTVVAPEAHYRGRGFWDTNVLPSSLVWDGAPDDRFVRKILAAIAHGTFGRVDTTRLYATGISSGGFMTSRMAITFPTLFRAVAIQSASYATCATLLCLVPDHLPDAHPPTLFLHGRRDIIVPYYTVRPYRQALERQHIETKVVVDEDAGHAWISAAPDEILTFFAAHR